MFIWMAIVFLIVALVFWTMGWIVLHRSTSRGLARVFFYIFLMAALVFLFVGYMAPRA